VKAENLTAYVMVNCKLCKSVIVLYCLLSPSWLYKVLINIIIQSKPHLQSPIHVTIYYRQNWDHLERTNDDMIPPQTAIKCNSKGKRHFGGQKWGLWSMLSYKKDFFTGIYNYYWHLTVHGLLLFFTSNSKTYYLFIWNSDIKYLSQWMNQITQNIPISSQGPVRYIMTTY
jgi:hypothetical protein